MIPNKVYVDGRWVDAAGGQTFQDLNPATGKPYAEVPLCDRADAASAIESGWNALDAWLALPMAQRAGILIRASQILSEKEKDFIRVLISESGATFNRARMEIASSIALLHQAGMKCLDAASGNGIEPGMGSMTEPTRLRGVIAVFPSWMFPLYSSIEKIIQVLAAGNPVLLVPSEDSPVVGLGVAEILGAAGMLPGAVNVITGCKEMLLGPISEDERVGRVVLTGLNGDREAHVKADPEYARKIDFEFYGKDPLIVLHGADLDFSAATAARHIFKRDVSCRSHVESIVVQTQSIGRFMEKLLECTKSLHTGNPAEKRVDVGPMINQAAAHRAHTLVNDAVSRGARLLIGGSYDRCLYKPTILSNITAEMRVSRSVIGGPVASVTAVKDEKEAVLMARTEKRIQSAVVIAKEKVQAQRLSRKIGAGRLAICYGGGN